MQRAHQHKTLEQIAGMIKQGSLSPEALKAYHCWISNENYPDAAAQQATEDQVEQAWPTFRDDTELGRIPSFVWRSDQSPHLFSESASESDLSREGHHWREQYDKAAQHRMERVQHHIHKLTTDGTRKPLPACIAPSRPGSCKHEFPMDSRLTTEALVICPGIAKERGLRVSGRRSMLEAILGSRNSPWLNGTARAFAVIFGFNTDVSPNDRLPITLRSWSLSRDSGTARRNAHKR